MINKIIQAVQMETINAAYATIQNYMGQDDGGVAGAHYNDNDMSDERWKNMDIYDRFKYIRTYIDLELQYLDIEPIAEVNDYIREEYGIEPKYRPGYRDTLKLRLGSKVEEISGNMVVLTTINKGKWGERDFVS